MNELVDLFWLLAVLSAAFCGMAIVVWLMENWKQ
jgi:hypothetical protein